MYTQTAEFIDDRKGLMQTLELLSDRALLQAKGYIERLYEEETELKEIDAEIARLRAIHGTTPNVETIAAMKEAESGDGEVTTIEEIMAELNAKD